MSYIVGITINPKLKEPVIVTATLDTYVRVRAFRMRTAPNDLWRKTDELGLPATGFTIEGQGYLDEDDPVGSSVNLFRVHTPAGVETEGQGFGTTLYCGASVTAYVIGEHQLEFPRRRFYKDGAGVMSQEGDRSEAAEVWWSRAVALDLAKDVAEEWTEEGISVDADASDLENCVDVTDEYPSGYVSYVNSINVDVTYDRQYNFLGFETVWEKELCAAVMDAPVPYNMEAMQPDEGERRAFDEHVLDADTDALLAVDVRGMSEYGVHLLASVLRGAKASAEDIRLMLLRWQYDVDPSTNPLQRTLPFKSNSSEGRAVREALERTKLRRREMDWNDFASLP